MLKIISGQARGIWLDVIPGKDVRPTPDRVRKALFDSWRNFSGLAVVDLYAGSGALGLEAASRGAAAVLLVEQNRRHCEVIRRNWEAVRRNGVTAQVEIRCVAASRVEAYAAVLPEPDLIFADPPYAESAAEFARLLGSEAFRRWMGGATLFWELPSEQYAYQKFLETSVPGTVEYSSYEGMTFLKVRLAN